MGKKYWLVFLVILVVLVGGVVLLSWNALPGTPFYSTKVNVVEKLGGVFIKGSEERAAWLIKRIDQRLFETEKLALKDKVPVGTADQIKVYLIWHWNELKDELRQLQSQNRSDKIADLFTSFSAMVEAHSRTVLVISGVSAEKTKDINLVLAEAVYKQQEAEESLKKGHAKILSESKDWPGLAEKARQEAIAEIEKAKSKKSSSRWPELLKWVEGQITGLEKMLQEESEKLKDKPADAFRRYRELRRGAQVLQYYIDVRNRLDLPEAEPKK